MSEAVQQQQQQQQQQGEAGRPACSAGAALVQDTPRDSSVASALVQGAEPANAVLRATSHIHSSALDASIGAEMVTEDEDDGDSRSDQASSDGDGARSELLYRDGLVSVTMPTLSELFAEFDVNGDGYIDVHEMHTALSRCGLRASEEQALEWLRLCGARGTDRITFIEFSRFYNMAKHVLWPTARHSDTTCMVFLGGSCNPTTWRANIVIPLFERMGVSYFNPQVEDWSPELLALESDAKDKAQILFFVVDGLTRSISSMLEVSEMLASGREVVLVINNIPDGVMLEGQVVTGRELKDLNRARAYLAEMARRRNIKVYANITEAAMAVIRRLRRLTSAVSMTHSAAAAAASDTALVRGSSILLRPYTGSPTPPVAAADAPPRPPDAAAAASAGSTPPRPPLVAGASLPTRTRSFGHGKSPSAAPPLLQPSVRALASPRKIVLSRADGGDLASALASSATAAAAAAAAAVAAATAATATAASGTATATSAQPNAAPDTIAEDV